MAKISRTEFIGRIHACGAYLARQVEHERISSTWVLQNAKERGLPSHVWMEQSIRVAAEMAKFNKPMANCSVVTLADEQAWENYQNGVFGE